MLCSTPVTKSVSFTLLGMEDSSEESLKETFVLKGELPMGLSNGISTSVSRSNVAVGREGLRRSNMVDTSNVTRATLSRSRQQK